MNISGGSKPPPYTLNKYEITRKITLPLWAINAKHLTEKIKTHRKIGAVIDCIIRANLVRPFYYIKN